MRKVQNCELTKIGQIGYFLIVAKDKWVGHCEYKYTRDFIIV